MGKGTKDRAEGRRDEAKGKVKEAAGDLTGDDRMESEGRLDQAKGNAKRAAGSAKDAIERGTESVKHALRSKD
jgi:uncharacterized protein YjbJ (UPF0337 family)